MKDRFTLWTQSVALGCPLTERVTMYVEYFGRFTHARADELSMHVFNVGLDFLITNDFIIDVRVGKGLSNDAEDLFAGIGGGYRF